MWTPNCVGCVRAVGKVRLLRLRPLGPVSHSRKRAAAPVRENLRNVRDIISQENSLPESNLAGACRASNLKMPDVTLSCREALHRNPHLFAATARKWWIYCGAVLRPEDRQQIRGNVDDDPPASLAPTPDELALTGGFVEPVFARPRIGFALVVSLGHVDRPKTVMPRSTGR